eukprot:8690428-Alexandrium_andersonii.AAC.1
MPPLRYQCRRLCCVSILPWTWLPISAQVLAARALTDRRPFCADTEHANAPQGGHTKGQQPPTSAIRPRWPRPEYTFLSP